MILYIYEETFQGFLTAIYEAFYGKEAPEDIVSQKDYQPSLTSEQVWVITEESKADKVYNAILNKISSNALRNIYYAYLSNNKNKGILVYRYLKFGFKKGKNLDNYLVDSSVKPIHDIRQKVTKEKHLLEGLLRFQLLENGIYYASIGPDHDITELLAPHFSKRMADQCWIIHDLSREKAVLYNKEEWVSTILKEKDIPSLKDEEKVVQGIWKQYFKHIAIQERKNLKLQRNFMPKRYWKYLIELEK